MLFSLLGPLYKAALGNSYGYVMFEDGTDLYWARACGCYTRMLVPIFISQLGVVPTLLSPSIVDSVDNNPLIHV
jgi:hypothetical protein